MGEPSLVQALLTIGFAALAGGITNAVAVWMLFHPHERRGIGRLAIQGAVPKNRPRLAKAIGRTVGERLLTADDLARQLASPGIREAFDDTVRAFVTSLLASERGALREVLPPAITAEVTALGERLGPVLADRLADWAASEEGRRRVADWLGQARARWGDTPVTTLLTEARRDALRDQLDAWAAQLAAHAEVEAGVRGWLTRQAARLGDDHTPLLDRLPPGVVEAVERAIAEYLPLALERLAAVVRDPDARARIERALHELFRRFLRDLMLHERIVARLVVTEKTIARALDNFDQEGADQLARLLDEPAMRTHVARNINDAVLAFLRRPLAAHVDALGPDRVQGIIEAATRQVLAVLQDAETRAAAIARVDRLLDRADDWNWNDVLDRLRAEPAARWLADVLATDDARSWIAGAWLAGFSALLDRPIGRPADHLGEDAADRITDALAPALWTWIQEQVPIVVGRVDIPAVVEQKVLGFSLDRMEEIVRRTTQRELDLIVRLGYLLGAIVGTAAYGISLLV